MPEGPIPQAISNIQKIAKLEQEFLERRTFTERLTDGVASFAGTMWFVLLQIVLMSAWILINTVTVPGIPEFDVFPFMLLTAIVTAECLFLTAFVLMKQNRMSRRADQRDQLNLQIDLLAEHEITKILKILQAVCEHLGVEHGTREAELEQLSEETAVDEIARELRQKIPE